MSVVSPRPQSASRPTAPGADPGERRRVIAIGALLTAMVWMVFGQTVGFAFTDYDDGEYVYENPFVTNGLSWRGAGWAFTHFYASNWHPLTWISHMADAQLYGSNAGGHHATKRPAAHRGRRAALSRLAGDDRRALA